MDRTVSQAAITREQQFAARNYAPLPVVLDRGHGEWLSDVDGKRYLDLMSAYSAVSHGHAHPRLVRALTEQAQRVAVTSRAYHTAALGPFLEKLTRLAGLDRALPASGGAESVETAIKAARRWGYRVKGIPADQAEIVVARGNFHGRSTTIVGFSSEASYRDGFGPFADRKQVRHLVGPLLHQLLNAFEQVKDFDRFGGVVCGQSLQQAVVDFVDFKAGLYCAAVGMLLYQSGGFPGQFRVHKGAVICRADQLHHAGQLVIVPQIGIEKRIR